MKFYTYTRLSRDGAILFQKTLPQPLHVNAPTREYRNVSEQKKAEKWDLRDSTATLVRRGDQPGSDHEAENIVRHNL